MDTVTEKDLQQMWLRMMFGAPDGEMLIYILPDDLGRLTYGRVYELEWVDSDGDVRWRSPVIYGGFDAKKIYFYYLLAIDDMRRIVKPDEFGKFSVNKKVPCIRPGSLGAITELRLVRYAELMTLDEIGRRRLNLALELESDKIRAERENEQEDMER